MTSETVALEPPATLLKRLRLGREEFCQRLLTMLILDGPYPRWNTRSSPSQPGVAFLRSLYTAQFGQPWPGDRLLFVDEFELAGRHEAEVGGAPDYTVLWADRLWLIELKTEKGSHRAGQIPGYFALARHHYPQAAIDLTYLTPLMEANYDPAQNWARYAHITWDKMVPLIQANWGSGRHQDHVTWLIDTINDLHLSPSQWRAKVLEASELPTAVTPKESLSSTAPPDEEALESAMREAVLVSADGGQRGVNCQVEDLQSLLDLRAAVRNRLSSAPADSPTRKVLPWIWKTESKGRPLTATGRNHGMELRLSRYSTDQYSS